MNIMDGEPRNEVKYQSTDYDILIVDDTPINLYYLKTVLEENGFSVKDVENGVTALKTIQERKPVLILLDIMMPQINGYEVCKSLKSDDETSSIPIIFISALDDSDSILKGFAAGGVDYISKPFNIPEVIARVRTHISLRKLQLSWESNYQELINEISVREEAEKKLKISLAQVQRLAGHLQSVREDERLMISREIHDDIGQLFTALKMELAMLKNDLNQSYDGTNASVGEGVESMMEIIEEGVKNVRQLILKLRPEILDTLGLLDALKWQVDIFNKQKQLECCFNSGVEELNFDKEISLAIFRILQEALNNIRKHSQATKVDIKLSQVENKIILAISDNGVGFIEDSSPNLNSFGIISMRERALLFGGKLEIESEPAKGTNIILTIPEGSV